ncbi:PLP-dependent aminotransferase family protein [Verticiella sediminum]|uniref:PLP-dependent aminotransferase family protein n=1 Tax=Verticiella sediminum TaxID=1247510 RepID=A0A556ACG1_9BURK|nr:PLP-dependent aminotransferase family protein [Verticiella sediminum]TSH90568.1 PLP-dependent aminotransferase family protein [Verticiella sediminum]
MHNTSTSRSRAAEDEAVRRTDRANWAELLEWEFQEGGDVPLYQQVANFLRSQIQAGVIPSGSRLPSTRQLMDRLRVSRTTVITAYSLLHADGYVVCRIGSGTYVATDVLDTFGQDAPVHAGAAPEDQIDDVPSQLWAQNDGLSERGARYARLELDRFVLDPVPFNTGVVRVDGRAAAHWQQIVRQHLATESVYQGYAAPEGSPEIRQEIARYVGVSRGIRCTAEQVILVAGSQQAIDLAIKVLLDPGAAVWVEDPGYPLTRMALETAGMDIRAIPVDQDGLRVSQGVATSPNARGVFVTPSHQYPLGVALSMRRRVELLEWAARFNAWVVEDDYDSEFRYSGPALPALKGLDRHDRVVYVGSFSKVLLPTMRYGYMVVPPALIQPFRAARLLADRHSPVFFEKVLAEYISRGHFVSHIRRMRVEYCHARDALVSMLQERAGHLVDVTAPGQGLHLIAYLRNGIPDTLAAQEAIRAGVAVRPISSLCSPGGARHSGLMLGFAGYSETRMRTAVDRLAIALEGLVRTYRSD